MAERPGSPEGPEIPEIGESGGNGRPPGRPLLWVLAALGVLVLVFSLMRALRESEPEPEIADVEAPAEATASGEEPVPAQAAERTIATARDMVLTVERFEERCVEADGGIGPDAERTAECLERLGEALDAVVGRDTVGAVVIDRELERFRRHAQRIETEGATGEGGAERVSVVLTSAAEVLGAVNESRYLHSADVDREVVEAREAARAVDPARPLREQGPQVREFFRQAAEVIRGMAGVAEGGGGG